MDCGQARNESRASPLGDNHCSVKQRQPQLPEVNFSDCGDIRYLHLGTEWVQGSMLLDKPFDIELEYVQRMMAWLLFVDRRQRSPQAPRHAAGPGRRAR